MIRHRSRSLEHHAAKSSTAGFWAVMTIGSFPVVMMLASSFGASILVSFFLGLEASLVAIFANGLMEKHLWMFDTRWCILFEHPDFSYRLAFISGVLLLIVETSILLFVFSSSSLDRALINLVYQRRCVAPTTEFQNFCDSANGL